MYDTDEVESVRKAENEADCLVFTQQIGSSLKCLIFTLEIDL